MSTYHKFVNTTPKPRATKNSKGELVGPPPPPLPPAGDVDAAGGAGGLVEEGAMDVLLDMMACWRSLVKPWQAVHQQSYRRKCSEKRYETKTSWLSMNLGPESEGGGVARRRRDLAQLKRATLRL